MRRVLALMGAAASLALAAPAAAQTFTLDFNDVALGNVAGGSFTRMFGALTVTVTGNPLTIVDRPLLGPGNERVATAGFFSGPLTITFSGGTVGAISARNPVTGQINGEVDVLRLRAFDASDVLLASVSTDATIASLGSASGVVRLVVDDDPLASTGFLVDDLQFTVDPTSTVPEPGTYALMATGLAGLAGVTWRRRRA